MICPTCKCEYIRGVTQCADCGIALVERLDPEEPDPDDVRLVAIWRGTDSSERDEVGKALESADIQFTFAEARSVIFRTSETTLEVWVADTEQGRASQVVADVEERLHPDESLTEEDASFALPESDTPQDDADYTDADSDIEQAWDEDEPVCEIWNGDSQGLADTLITCFREVGIAARKMQDAVEWRVEVRPAQEKRARGIVREVVDASPPQ